MNSSLLIFKNSSIADYEICNIRIDYAKKSILIDCISYDMKNILVSVDNFCFFSISHKEPWGEGKYVASSDIIIDNTIAKITIELNSGDIILIDCKV